MVKNVYFLRKCNFELMRDGGRNFEIRFIKANMMTIIIIMINYLIVRFNLLDMIIYIYNFEYDISTNTKKM